MRLHQRMVMGIILLLAGLSAFAAESRVVVDPTVDEVTLKTSSDQVTVARESTGQSMGLAVRIAPGEDGYPGLTIAPKDGSAWDLSAHGHVAAKVINTGTDPLYLMLRVDNAGDWKDSTWNTEARSIKPGETGTVKVIFGHAHGFKPGYKLDPARVSQMILFTGKVKKPVSFSVVSIVADGAVGEKPAVNPADVRVKPADGIIMGQGAPVDLARQVSAKGATAEAVGDGVQLTFDAGKSDLSATFKPAVGRWDLRDATQVTVTLRNTGPTPISPRVRVESNGGPSGWAGGGAPISPGEERAITAPFGSAAVWRGPDELKGEFIKGQAGTEYGFTSDAASGVSIVLDKADASPTLVVRSITAEAPPVTLPEWVGRRPPVEGDWKLSFEDNFDGSSIDRSRWNVYTANFWDKRSHFTKDNVIMEDGVVKLRYEKKRGFHNDNPAEKETDFAVGFLDTYGKWVQRYGYFEARMKLPTAPGLWPAFWMMPDRGADKGPQWARADTKFGGMEFDIMEHLTRWGPHRYSTAMHWDGYQKEHKATGAERIYAAHDKDGFITSGLLWLPGQAVFYCNGVEVARWDNERVCNVPSYPILYMVSGGWDNNALDESKLPDDFVIDYIRIWQRSDLASEVDGPQSDPAPIGPKD